MRERERARERQEGTGIPRWAQFTGLGGKVSGHIHIFFLGSIKLLPSGGNTQGFWDSLQAY